MQHVLRYDEVLARYPEDAWQNAAARDIASHVTANSGRSFPCVFAVRAVVQGGFRYCFAETAEGGNMAAGLTDFLRNARAVGSYATLFYVFPPNEVQSLERYHDRFWNALKQLHRADEKPWPDHVPYSITDPDWTFCFDGEPLFPLCLTPAHVKKKTRHAQNFSISFQPRWTFKHHLPNFELMQKYSDLIREKMKAFDESPISPYLGLYGAGFLDAQKYFFHDDNLPMCFPESLR
jgi:hypothetical protein